MLALSFSLSPALAADTITITDTEGREIQVPHGAERVLLGFYYEDFYAIVGEGAYDRVVAISREPWEGWRNTQFQAYSRVTPRIADLTDVGYEEAGGFSIEKAIAAKPDVAIIAGWQYRGLGAEGVAKLGGRRYSCGGDRLQRADPGKAPGQYAHHRQGHGERRARREAGR